MSTHLVRFEPDAKTVQVPSGTLIVEAARQAELEIGQPCGGQGRCGRCVVRVDKGIVRRRSTLRLLPEDVEAGYALACQSVIERDITVFVPPQRAIERRLSSDRSIADITIPDWYDRRLTGIKRFHLSIDPPSMDDQRDDLSRLKTSLKKQHGFTEIKVALTVIKEMGAILRQGNWDVTAVVEIDPKLEDSQEYVRLIRLIPGHVYQDDPLWGAAIDIGTTTVTLWLVDLITGEVKTQISEYNGQINRGEDVISRIVYANREGGRDELQRLILQTVNSLLDSSCKQIQDYEVNPKSIVKMTVAGNSTMIHLFLGIPPENIRLSPFVTTVNDVPEIRAIDIGVNICSDGIVDCLPGVASFVGSDITSGVLSSGMDETPQITLFMDVGTNGEIVLGSREWLVSCACSAGPAFEGAGVRDGMRATRGAIEEIWINGETFEPSYRVIGNVKPKGICGSGLISALAELFMTGVVDKAGNLNSHLQTSRVRMGENGLEYIIARKNETEYGKDIVMTHTDINNLVRAKAAIYAGYAVLADSVGVPIDLIEQMLIGGSFGKYINIEKAIQIGLLPDLPWERFKFLGNTSVRGAYYSLLDKSIRERIQQIASRMTYIELSADNTFYEAFMSALFLPHTEMKNFPTVSLALEEKSLIR